MQHWPICPLSADECGCSQKPCVFIGLFFRRQVTRVPDSPIESALSGKFFALNGFDKQGEVPETGVQGFVIFM